MSIITFPGVAQCPEHSSHMANELMASDKWLIAICQMNELFSNGFMVSTGYQVCAGHFQFGGKNKTSYGFSSGHVWM